MTLREKLLIGLAVVLVLGLGAALYEAHVQAVALSAAQATSKASGETIKAAQGDITQLEASLAVTNAALEDLKKTPETPQKFVIDLSKYIPGLPQPPQVVPGPTTGPVAPGTALPDAPTPQGVLIPAADLQALRNYGLTCQQDQNSLVTCQAVGKDKDAQLTAMTGDRDNWKNLASGGTKTRRFFTALQHGACGGAGVGAGIGVGYETKSVGNGFIAGFGGAGTCELTAWLIGRKK